MSTLPQRDRQRRAYDKLQKQLDAGTKNTKDGKPVELTDKDRTRIHKEMQTLKERM